MVYVRIEWYEWSNREMVKKKKGFGYAFLVVLFISYLIILVYFLFFSERYGRTIAIGEYHYNLHLFKEIRRFFRYRKSLGTESVVVNLLGNVFAFSPFGFFLPCLDKKYQNILRVTMLGFEFSFTIELLQLVTRAGIFDVDDLFMNTLGAGIGYTLFFIVFGKKKKKKAVKKESIGMKIRRKGKEWI